MRRPALGDSARCKVLTMTAGSPTTPVAEVPALAAACDPVQLLASARYHRLSSALHVQFADPDRNLDRALVHGARDAHLEQVARLMSTTADLATLGSVLGVAGIRWLTVKGPVLQHALYAARPAVRECSGLDVIVQEHAVVGAVEALSRAGAVAAGQNLCSLQRRGVAQVGLRLPSGTALDLRWRLFSLPEVRSWFPWSTPELFHSPATTGLLGRSVLTLDAEDTLLHLCAHAALSGASRLGRLADVSLASQQTVDWDLLVHRARRRRLGLMAAVVLDRARRAVAAPVPHQVTDALHPRRGWRALLDAADAVRPPAAVARPVLTLESVYRSSRPSVPWTVVALAGSLRRHGRPDTDAFPGPGDASMPALAELVRSTGREPT